VVDVHYDGQHYCPVHRPEKVLDRVRAIVIEACSLNSDPKFIEKAILAQLEETV
jgi:hypothetical protein